jgi:hypothetical protein
MSSVARAALGVIALGAMLGPAADAPASFDAVVRERILPQTGALFRQLLRDKRELTIDGMRVFNGDDKFLPGKIAVAFTEYLLSLPKDAPELAADLSGFRDIARMTVDDANDTWGEYYYLVAIDKLRTAGLLERALDRATYLKLRVRLDWRTFVDPDTYQLIDHPNNYYVVALGIARLRHDLGWEDATGADAIYQKVAQHYRRYSGEFGFADETDGDGRFDRYSVLLAGELANHFIETGGRPPDEALGWLRHSADVMLMRIHADGGGFEYGRSLGPYAETAIIETLTAAARLAVLTDAERDLAYAYSTRAARRYVDFWVDGKTGSVDLWGGGRRTDAYRGKFRILGENLSLAYQFAYTDEGWNAMGYRNRPAAQDLAGALARLPTHAVTWFARGTYDRLLVTRRDGGHVIGLPIINGGASQHAHVPYFPIPFSQGMVEAIADSTAPVLVPRFTLKDGTQLMPLAFMRDVRVDDSAGRTTVTYRQTEMDHLGGSAPVADARLAVATTYTLQPHTIVRTDVFTPGAALDLSSIRLEFATFSETPTEHGTATQFASGAVTSFSAEGLETCHSRALDHDRDYASDTGPMKALVVCTSGAMRLDHPLTIRWTMTYR